MSDMNLKFEDIFKLTTACMRINRSHPSIARDKTFKIYFACLMTLYGTSFYFLLYSILFHDIAERNFAEVCKNATMAIVAVTFTFKYSILLLHQDSVRDLIDIVDKDYELAKKFSEEEKQIIIEYSKRGVKLSKLWLWSLSTGCVIFPAKAFYLMAYSYWNGHFEWIQMFDITYPSLIEQYKHHFVIFTSLFVLTLAFDSLVLTMYMGFDPLVPIFMLHTCGQLDILNKKISKLFDDGIEAEITKKELKSINKKLQEIYCFVETIKNNFTIVYEFIMKSTTFLLPLTLFQIIESIRIHEINVEFIAFMTGALLHFYMPCYYSNLLKDKSEELRQAIYSCGWEKSLDKSARSSVLIMLVRTIKPQVISTVFFPICLDTFAVMCRDAYTIFNLMNASLS